MSELHPAADLLRQYSVGQMSDESAGELEQHLAECPQCEETLDNLAVNDETLISELRRPAVVDPVLEEPELREALAQIVEHAAGVSEAADGAGDSPEGREIGVYRLLEELGKGGMGTVYRALHSRLEKVVALKILATERLKDPHAVSRFDREMKAVGKLEHPHIVRAFDAGEADGQHFLVTEYVEGADLSQLSRKLGPLPIADACELARQAALGLEEAHEHGMVHRDIKPANLFLARQKNRAPMVKVLDLGLALIAGEHAPTDELTGTGQIMGTIDYMAPEQAGDTHNVDIRADVYSLGATLYRLLTGSSIYRSDKQQSVMQKLSALANEPTPPIQARRAEVPDDLAAVVHRMLEKDPSARLGTPAEVVSALEPFCGEHDLKALLQPAEVERTIVDTAAANSDSVHDGSVETQDAVDPGLQPTVVSTADHVAVAETVVRPRSAGRGWARWVLGGLALALLAAAGLYYSGILVKLKTPDGTLVIEVENAEAEGLVVEVNEKKQAVEISADGKSVIVSVEPGAKRLVVKTADGTVLKIDANERIEIASGTSKTIRAWLDTSNQALSKGELTDKEADKVRRQLAAWVLTQGGHFTCVAGNENPNSSIAPKRITIRQLSDLPKGEFRFWSFYMNDSDLIDSDMTQFQQLKELPESYHFNLRGNKRLSNEAISHLKGLDIYEFEIDGTEITDDGLIKLSEFSLYGLRIHSKHIDGSGLANLASIKGLYYLNLSDCSVTNENLRHISILKDLRKLNLSSNESLTDGAIAHLGKATQLEGLALSNTSMTADGIRELSKSLPDCRIVWDGGVIDPKAPLVKPWKPTEAQKEFIDRVAMLPVGDQVEAVRTKLKEVNPGFDGEVWHTIEEGVVFKFGFETDNVSDIWPVHALPQLKILSCAGTNAGRGKLSSLEPLQGLQLTVLNCNYNKITDLAPLQGMPLTEIYCDSQKVADLSPLRGMRLRVLSCTETDVDDLAPVSGMPLDALWANSSQVANLAPLTGMQLKDLQMSNSSVTDLSPLKGMKIERLELARLAVSDLSPLQGMPLTRLNLANTRVVDLSPLTKTRLWWLNCAQSPVWDLKPLNGLPLHTLVTDVRLYDHGQHTFLRQFALGVLDDMVGHTPVADFWKTVDARRAAAESFANSTAGLSSEQRIEAVLTKLKELNRNDLVLGRVVKEGHVVEVTLRLVKESQDITPLMAFSELKQLTLRGGPDWLDISAVTRLPLEVLICKDSIVRKNSSALKTIATLKTINGKPAAEYWRGLPRRLKGGAK